MQLQQAIDLLRVNGGTAYVDQFIKQMDHFQWTQDKDTKDYLIFISNNCSKWFDECYPGFKTLQAKKKLQAGLSKLLAIEEVKAELDDELIGSLKRAVKTEIAKVRSNKPHTAAAQLADTAQTAQTSEPTTTAATAELAQTAEDPIDDAVSDSDASSSAQDIPYQLQERQNNTTQWMIDALENERDEKLVLHKRLAECQQRMERLEDEMAQVRDASKKLKENFLDLMKSDFDRVKLVEALGGIIFLP